MQVFGKAIDVARAHLASKKNVGTVHETWPGFVDSWKVISLLKY